MRFIGCKENLLGFIENFVKQKDIRGNTFCDLFAGTGSVAKHFKKGMMISINANFFKIIVFSAYPDTFLRICGTGIRTLSGSKKHILELIHSRVGEEQGRILEWDNGGTRDYRVTTFSKKV